MVLGRPSCSWSGDQHNTPRAGGQHHNLRYLPYQATGTANTNQPSNGSYSEGDFTSPPSANIIPRSTGQQHNQRFLPYPTMGNANSHQPSSGTYSDGDFTSPPSANITPRSAGQQHNPRYLSNYQSGTSSAEEIRQPSYAQSLPVNQIYPRLEIPTLNVRTGHQSDDGNSSSPFVLLRGSFILN